MSLFDIPTWPTHLKWHVLWHCVWLVCSTIAGGAEPLAKDLALELPAGISAETDPLTLPNVHGFEVCGRGTGDFPKHPGQRGTMSGIRRTLVVNGANHYLHDFSTFGASVGIHLEFMRGCGTGGLVLERWSCFDAGIAWKIGHDYYNSMCDTSVWRSGVVRRCDYVVHQRNPMAIQNRVDGVIASQVRKAFFYAAAGGNSAIRDSAITRVDDDAQCAFLHLGDGIGSNQWSFTLENCKLDAQCEDRAELLHMEAPRAASVVLLNVHVAHDKFTAGKYLYNLHDEARVIVIGGEALKTTSIFVHDTPRKEPPTFEVIGYPGRDLAACVAPGSGPVRFIRGGEDFVVGGSE